jgi:1-acyl-sn-glycerol-3-phosphate acyltransferase
MVSAEATGVVAVCLLGGLALALVGWAAVWLRRSPFGPIESTLYGLNYLLARIRWRTEVVGRLPLAADRGAVIVSNHRCPADPSFFYLTTSRVVHWMVAREYCGLPVLGWFLRTCQVIPVRRGAIDTAAMKQSVRLAREGGLIGVFPEGRLNTTDQLLLPGRSGAAMIAIKAGVPVIPCFIGGAPYDGTTLGCLLMSARARLVIGRPIDVAEYAGRENNRRAIDDLTKRLLREIAELGGHPDYRPKLAGRARD